MKADFVESPDFTEWVARWLPDDVLSQMQQALMANPELGDVMPGCGGLRKLRIADPRRGRGKRGGARVIYLHLPDVRLFYLLDIYGKDEQDDLSPQQKKALAELSAEMKRAARTRRTK